MMTKLYPSHPYGYNPHGDLKVTANLSMEDVHSFFLNQLQQPWVMTCAITKHNHSAKVREEIEAMACKWLPQTSKQICARSTITPLASGQSIHKSSSTNSHIHFGFRTTPLIHKKWPHFEIIAALLTGDGGGVLYQTLREQYGTAYTVEATTEHLVECGNFIIYVNTSSEKQPFVVDKTRSILSEYTKKCFEGDELLRAKNFVLSSYLIGLQRSAAKVNYAAQHILNGITIDEHWFTTRVKNVSAEEIMQIMREHLHPDQAIIHIEENV